MAKNFDPEINLEEAVFDDLSYREFDYRELPTSNKPFIFIGILAVLAAGVVLIQLATLNFGKGQFYEARALANVSEEINLPTYRALIVDRFGEVLAKNKSSFSLFLNVASLFKTSHSIEPVLAELAKIIDADEDELRNLILQVDLERDNWIPLKRNITLKEAIEVKGLNQEYLEVVDDFEREYLEAPVFAHVLGYTGIGEGNLVAGKSGLELQYDDLIRGRDGHFILYRDARGNLLDKKAVSEPAPSSPLETTIDAGLMRFFYKRLKQGLESLGRERGVGLALNPKNGEILALVSLPSFDSNIFVERKRNAERQAILEDSSEPLFNRVISGLYSPGSVIKPLVALAALKENVLDSETRIFSKGVLEIPNPYNPDEPSRFPDWQPHGWVDVRSALARSSNVFFYAAGGGLPGNVSKKDLVEGNFDKKGVSISRLRNYWNKFGLGARTLIDLPYEAEGFLPSPEDKEEKTGDFWRLGDTYNVAIGQGDLTVTPLQLLQFLAFVGNGGKVWKPFLNKNTAPEVLIDYSEDLKEEIKEVQQGLKDAVFKPYGTSRILSGLPMAVAGKTGTPQTGAQKKLNAIFAGYAPADDPEIAILVLVEGAREGSLNALPIAKDVFEWFYLNRLAKN